RAAASLVSPQRASIRRAAGGTFHIFKILSIKCSGVETDIVRFADEYRPSPPPPPPPRDSSAPEAAALSVTWDVVVIGAGAAGMMCAAQAGQRGRRVLLIEHSH